MVAPAVAKQDTKFRKSVDRHISFAIALRYWATGDIGCQYKLFVKL